MRTITGKIRFFGVGCIVISILASWAIPQNAPPRPICTDSAPCNFNEENGLGEGSRVILFDHGDGGHQGSARRLYTALNELSQEHGFTLTRKSNAWSNLSDADLNDAKVIIYSSSDGDIGRSIPNSGTQDRVENFVKERGWGLLLIHAACAFIDSWPFLQDACIQQFNNHNPTGTQATHYLENRTVDGAAHGLLNPYTDFLLGGLNERESMRDEWYTWRGNPRNTHQYGNQRNNQVQNRIMLTALDEGTYVSPTPRFPNNHYTAWTHTMGEGIVIYNSTGHDDIWRLNEEQHGKELLWRMMRYVAKDWAPVSTKTKVCTDELAGNTDIDFDPETEVPDPMTCRYCGDDKYKEYVAGKEESQYNDEHCELLGINIAGFRVNDFITTDKLNINVTYNGEYNLQLVKPNGEIVLNIDGIGAKKSHNPVKEAGIYYVKLSAPGFKTHVKKLLVK